MLDSKSKSELSESSGVSIEEQRGEGLSKNGEEEGEDALFVAGWGEFEGTGEEFAEKLALQSDSRGAATNKNKN